MSKISNINDSNLNYVRSYPREIFDTIGLSYTNNSTGVVGRSGACFAVRKERISSIDKQKLITLKERIFALPSKNEVRRMCCGFESTWHAVLGEEYEIPRTSSVDHLWEPVLRNTKGKWNGKLFLNYTLKDDLDQFVWHYQNKTSKTDR